MSHRQSALALVAADADAPPAWAVRLEANQARIEAKVDQLLQPRGSALSRADRALLARALPPLAGVFGSQLWTAREALTHPSIDVQLALTGLSAKSFGRLCRRAAAEPIDGLRVSAQGSEAGAILWCLQRVR
ncbi:MAG: hypothetical protein ABIS29_05140 [Vicinamibacterales bacterium]